MRHEKIAVVNPLDRSNGEPAKFGAAIITISPALQRFALQLTRNHSAADDLVQDTLARAWAAQSQFAPGSNMKAWLFRIARNAFLSELHRTRRQVDWDPDSHPRLLVQVATQDDGLYARDLSAALLRLPAAQRSALQLIVQDGLSVADAAGELGVAVGTIKSRVARARASILASVIGERGGRYGPGPAAPAKTSNPLPAQLSSSDPALADRHGPSPYEQWKASGATMIG